MRRRLILRQGDKPPETPGPLSLGIYVPERKKSVKGSQAAQKPGTLDRFLPFRRATGMRERGPLGGGSPPPLVGGEQRNQTALGSQAKNFLPRRPPARYNNLRSWPRPYGRF